MNTERFQLNFFLGLLVAVLAFTAVIFLPFLAPIALAVMFAVVLKPVQRFFMRYMKQNSTLASLMTTLFFVVIVLVPLAILGLRLFQESFDFYTNLSDRGLGDLNGIVTHYASIARNYLPAMSIEPAQYAKAFADWLSSNIGNIFSHTTRFTLDIVLCVVTLFYVLRDGHSLKRTLIELSPLADKYDEEIMVRLEQAVNSVILGSLLTALVQGIFTGVGFAFFAIPHAVLFGAIAIFAALIPFGTALVVIPGAVYLFVTGDTVGSLVLLVWGVVVIGTIDNFLKPMFMGPSAKSHPLFILLALLGGIIFFGPVGVFLGPLLIALLFALVDIYKLLIIDDTNKKRISL